MQTSVRSAHQCADLRAEGDERSRRGISDIVGHRCRRQRRSGVGAGDDLAVEPVHHRDRGGVGDRCQRGDDAGCPEGGEGVGEAEQRAALDDLGVGDAARRQHDHHGQPRRLSRS